MNHSRPTLDDPSPLARWLPIFAVIWLVLYWVLFFSSDLPNAGGGAGRMDVVRLLPDIYRELLGQDPQQAATSGWRFFPQRFDILLYTGFVGITALSAGRLVLRSLGLFSTIDRPTCLALGSSLGLSAISLFTLLLGSLGHLSRTSFVTAFLAAILGEGWFCYRDHRLLSQAKGTPPSPTPRPGIQKIAWICGGLCVPFLLCMLLGSMLPCTDFDSREYHLQGPKEYFEAGRVMLLPHNVYTSFPFLTEMLTLAAMVVKGDWFRGALVGQAVLMLFAPVTALGVWCVTRRVANDAAAWFAAVAFLSTPWAYRISIIPYTEGALCCYVIMTLLAVMVWREQERQDSTPTVRWLFVIGLLAGNAVATKYPGMVFVAIPIGALILAFQVHDTGRALPPLVRSTLIYGAGVLITFGPWMLKNLIETGNPVYPLLYTIFGGFDWNPEMNAKWKAAHSTPREALWNIRAEVENVVIRNDWQSPLLFGLAPLAFLRRCNSWIYGVVLDAAIILAAWFFLTHRIDRFWVPVIPLIAVLAGCGLANLLSLNAGPRETRTPKVFQLCASALVAFALVYNFGFITTSLAGNNMYLQDETVARRQAMKPAIALLEELPLPAGSKVLFVGEAEVFDATFPHRYNTVFDDSLLEEWTSKKTGPDEWELLPVETIRENLRREGITDVFVNWSEILRYRTTYRYTNFVSPKRIQQLVELGVLEPIPLTDPRAFRLAQTIQGSEETEVERWGPELKRRYQGLDVIEQFQLFRVID